MALCILASAGAFTFTRLRMPPRSHIPGGPSSIAAVSGGAEPQRTGANIKMSSNRAIVRQSVNYQPPIWGYDNVQSLRSENDVRFFLIIAFNFAISI